MPTVISWTRPGRHVPRLRVSQNLLQKPRWAKTPLLLPWRQTCLALHLPQVPDLHQSSPEQQEEMMFRCSWYSEDLCAVLKGDFWRAGFVYCRSIVCVCVCVRVMRRVCVSPCCSCPLRGHLLMCWEQICEVIKGFRVLYSPPQCCLVSSDLPCVSTWHTHTYTHTHVLLFLLLCTWSITSDCWWYIESVCLLNYVS